MAGASDKARFYLEQSVPELQEFERKGIFTKPEISSIAKRRSHFEHKLNARGSQPSDYIRYAEYEINLDTLRRKRAKRVGVKAGTTTGQRRIFFIFDRATRKFHGDVGLWIQYIDYARKEKANKKVTQLLTSLLRMHPTKPELWIYAAQCALDTDADTNAARNYMQMGLRFCRSSKSLWLEFAKLEMMYLAKLAARRRVLGLDRAETDTVNEVEDDGMISLSLVPSQMEAAIDKDKVPNMVETATAGATPVSQGAIPLTIHDAAMKQFQHDLDLGMQFFDMFSTFTILPFLADILQYVVDSLTSHAPTDPRTQICYLRFPVEGIEVLSSSFPTALGVMLERMEECMSTTDSKEQLATLTKPWLSALLEAEGLDEDIQKVLKIADKQVTPVANPLARA